MMGFSGYFYIVTGTLLFWGTPEAHKFCFETTATIITLVLLGNVLEHHLYTDYYSNKGTKLNSI